MMIGLIKIFSGPKKPTPRNFPPINVEIIKKEYSGKGFASPNPDITVAALDHQGNAIGNALYAISPLEDRLYLFSIEIETHSRRKGYGLAFLKKLFEIHSLPITVIKPISSALSFWESARRELMDLVPMTQSLSISEMDAEKSRWCHLQPKIDQLEQAILQRHIRGEPYAQAVGRGIEE
jgi:hypothetical protein